MLQKIAEYLLTHRAQILVQVRDHLLISLYALLAASLIGIVSGYFASRSNKAERWISLPFNVLRVVPSLAVLVLLIPVIGTGVKSAVTALTILAVPPILLNTVVGFREVPRFMTECAAGIGIHIQPGQKWILFFSDSFYNFRSTFLPSGSAACVPLTVIPSETTSIGV